MCKTCIVGEHTGIEMYTAKQMFDILYDGIGLSIEYILDESNWNYRFRMCPLCFYYVSLDHYGLREYPERGDYYACDECHHEMVHDIVGGVTNDDEYSTVDDYIYGEGLDEEDDEEEEEEYTYDLYPR